ncbi:hypothetical protein R6Q57_002097 [Mikania cordata]
MANLRTLFEFYRFLNATAAPAGVHGGASANGIVRYQSLCRHCVNPFSRFYSTNDGSESLDVDMSNEESKRRLVNRLVYRSKQRGFRELDLVLGSWVEDHIGCLDDEGIRALIAVLNLENPDLWKWLTRQEQPPESIHSNPVFNMVRSKIKYNLDNYASQSTQVTPGQPWVTVRGWEDFKKRRDNPIVEHQLLVQSLEECKFSRNSTAVTGTHARIIKLGYETCPSLTSLLVTSYMSFNHHNFACQLLNEVPYWKFKLVTCNSIITSFMKMGDVDIAKKVFGRMPKRDIITWNSMIGGFVRNARFDEAFRFFKKMLNLNMEPDKYTFSSIITSCGRVGALDQAKWVHGLLTEKRIEINFILSSALIDMYSKCGRIETAKSIFEKVKHDDVSVWNAMITGLAMHGLAMDALATFSKMEDENTLPDSITFVGILTACSHCGLTQQGREYFNLMRTKYAIEPGIEHYGSMVDLYGRAGLLEEAYEVIKGMPMDPDVVIWRAFLSACRTHKNPSLGEFAVSKISHLDSGDYVLLSNAYCSVSKWDTAENVRHMMRQKGVNKSKGKSWIKFGGFIHQFKSGDKSHRETDSIYKILEGLIGRVKEEGFKSVTELVLMDISEEEKEGNLNYHSEKLALAYGILKSSPGSEIRVSKNLRTCIDCHSWMKLVSKVLKRVIIVRDRIRFHRIEDGACTCGDYW